MKDPNDSKWTEHCITGPILTRTRGRLPHWESSPATYFVTFRLADSLPQAELSRIEEQRQIYLRAMQAKKKLSPTDVRRIETIFSEKVDKYLDSGAGLCILKNEKVAEIVKTALFYFHPTRYHLFAWVIMPNHVHVVFQPSAGNSLPEILHSWKSFTSKQIMKLLGLNAKIWKKEYYDHLVRDQADFERVVEYTLMNPEKAGLKNWPWVGPK